MEYNEQAFNAGEQASDSDNEITIDLGRIFRALWHYAWIIVLAVILCAVIMFGYTKLFVTEKYTSSATLYVSNNNSTTITSSDSNVADVVSTVITSRDTINLAIEDGGLSDYDYKAISDAMTVTVGDAGILTFSVELSSAQDAYNVAEALIEALNKRATGTENIFKDSIFFNVITSPVVPTEKSSPNTTRNVIIGALVGAVISVVVIVIIELVNNKIYDNDYLFSTYSLPVLVEIPDFAEKNNNKKYVRYYEKNN